MKQVVVAVFGSPLRANEAVRVLVDAGFAAERLPSIANSSSRTLAASALRLLKAVAFRLQGITGNDATPSPYARALASGCFVVKVRATDDAEASAARDILRIAGGTSIDMLADEGAEPVRRDRLTTVHRP